MQFSINKCACLLLVVYAGFVLIGQQADMLYAIQDFNPWLGTYSYWQQHIGHPGGLREWAGDWLTQLFYYPWIGAALLIACWTASAWALIKANRLHGWWCLLAFIPMYCLLASITEMGYWMFCLKAPSYWMGPTLGLLTTSLSLLCFSRSKENGRLVWLALMILGGYPALGWYATLAVLTMLMISPWQANWQIWFKRIIVIAVPLIIVTVYYHHSSAIHWHEDALMYGFHHLINPEASSMILELPFWLMAATVLTMPLFALLQSKPDYLNYIHILHDDHLTSRLLLCG